MDQRRALAHRPIVTGYNRPSHPKPWKAGTGQEAIYTVVSCTVYCVLYTLFTLLCSGMASTRRQNNTATDTRSVRLSLASYN